MKGRCKQVKKAGTCPSWDLQWGLRRTGWEVGCLILHEKQLSEQDSLAPSKNALSFVPLPGYPGDQFLVSHTSTHLDHRTTSFGHCIVFTGSCPAVVSDACLPSCAWLPLSSVKSIPVFSIQTPQE